jgi:hypothetical protein
VAQDEAPAQLRVPVQLAADEGERVEDRQQLRRQRQKPAGNCMNQFRPEFTDKTFVIGARYKWINVFLWLYGALM